jgi:predicted DNA-binding protein
MPDPIRSIRVPDELWEAAQDKASTVGDTISDVVRKALLWYVNGP